MSNLTTSATKVQPIGISHGIFGYNTDVSRGSPDVRVEILQRIDCALENIGDKKDYDVRFFELYQKLKVLRSYIITRQCLPSFKVSILIALCTYIQSISSRHIGPSLVIEKRQPTENKDTIIGATTEEISSPQKQKKLDTRGSWTPQPKKETDNNLLTEDASVWPPTKTKKKSVLSKISKKMKKSKQKKEDRKSPSSPKKQNEQIKKPRKAAAPARASRTKNTNESTGPTLKGRKGIAPARFRQVGAIIDTITSQKPIHEYAVTVLGEIDIIIAELRHEEFEKGWIVQFFSQESKLLRFLKPTVDHQWQPILVFMRLILLPIVLPLVRLAFSTLQSWDDETGYHIATMILCLLAAPTLSGASYKKDYSDQFTAYMIMVLLLRLMVGYFTFLMFAIFTVLFFSDVSCKRLASFFVQIFCGSIFMFDT